MEQEISKALEEAKPAIIAKAVEAAKESLAAELSWKVKDQVNDVLKDFLAEEVIPELKEVLQKNKSSIIDELSTVYVGIGAEVAIALKTQVQQNLAQSWNVSKIADGLFK